MAVNDRDRTPIRPEYVAGLANRLAADDAVFTVDVGSPVVWAARYLTMNGRRRLIGSFNHGTMACALPHAIGAQTAFRDRQVVALAGDGGLTMLFGELITLIQNRLPVKVIVFNNSSLNFVELEMKAAGIVNFGTDLVNPDFAAVAQAMGMFGRRVEQPADLEQALTDAFAYDGPAVVDVVTARQELSIPPAITVEQAKGFSLYAIRTILAGRADELLDLVTTNVARRLLTERTVAFAPAVSCRSLMFAHAYQGVLSRRRRVASGRLWWPQAAGAVTRHEGRTAGHQQHHHQWRRR